MPEYSITNEQRRHIFALARGRGHTTDALRAMTPAGSISMLTRMQASQLIEALKHDRSPNYADRPSMPERRRRPNRRPPGVLKIMTDEQREKIEALRIELGWKPAQLTAWLSDRRFRDEERPLTEMRTTKDAAFVIELLKRVVEKSDAARQRSTARRVTA